MSAKANLEAARKFYDAANRHDVEMALALLSPDMAWEMVPIGETIRGIDGFREMWLNGQEAFPDLQIVVENLIAADDEVVCEVRCVGTQTGPMKTPQGTIPPTNKKSDMRMLDIWEFRDGKVIRGRTYYDTTPMLEQMQKAA